MLYFIGTNELYCIHSESSGSEVFIHTFYNGAEDPTNDVYNFACWVSQ